jgi:hypothetical protein
MPVTQVVAARRCGAVRVAIGHGVGYGSVRGVKINREGGEGVWWYLVDVGFGIAGRHRRCREC